MILKRTLIALLLAISTIGFYGFNHDDDILLKVNQQLTEWADEHPIEKAYLHFDKPYYTAGDDIWFKAYITSGNLHQLTMNNDILHVELVNNRDSVVKNIKLQVNDGTAFGDFALPDTLQQGDYHIRAYTQYMLNAGSSYIFDRAITIGNVSVNQAYTKTEFNPVVKNGQSNIAALISYTNADGKPYAGNTVTYTVRLNNELLQKGKGVTDDSGNLQVVLPYNVALYTSGTIFTRLTVGKGVYIDKAIPIRTATDKADVQFFPEGGNIINNIPIKIAYKAIGTNGLGLDIKGVIVNTRGAVVAKLGDSHLGMGVFEFTPKAGESYHAELTFPDGSKRSMDIPAANDRGYVLNVVESGPQNLRLTVASAKGIAAQCYIVGQANGKVYYSAKSINSGSVFSAVVPKRKFPSGIVQFTVFSASGDPLNERLFFIQNPGDNLNLAITTNSKSYSPRQKVKLNIDATDYTGDPAEGNISISVTDETRVPVDENLENNILASLLLTSDIKGYVEKPAYYFNNVGDKTRSQLDALMLTQGYRRFEWKNILDGKWPEDKYTHQATFTISGRVVNKKDKPIVNGKVELIDYENAINNLDVLTDADGRFKFENVIYPDSSNFFIFATTDKGKKDVFIKMDTVPSPLPHLRYKNMADFNINPIHNIAIYEKNSKELYAQEKKFGLGNHVRQLPEVVIKDKFKRVKNSANLNPELTDQVLMDKDIGSGCKNLIDCLQGRIAGVTFKGGKPFSDRTDRPMLAIVDGMPDPEGKLLPNLNYNDVQSIEVIRGGKVSIYGFGSGNGVIFVTTRRTLATARYNEPLDGRNLHRDEPGVIRYRPKGAYTARVFYSPMYDAKTNAKIADLRTTIFWKPDLIATDGKATVEFANAGNPGVYRVVVEGIGSDGSIGRQVFRYVVQ